MRKLTTQKAFEAWLAKTQKRFYGNVDAATCCPLAKYTGTEVGVSEYGTDSRCRLPKWAVDLVDLFDTAEPCPKTGKQALALIHPKGKGASDVRHKKNAMIF